MTVVFYGVLIVCVLALVLAVGYLAGGMVAGLLAAFVLSGCVLIYHLYCMHQFVVWLQNDMQTNTTRIRGVWQNICTQIIQKDKHYQKKQERQSQLIARLNRMISAIPSAVLLINEKGQVAWKNALADTYFGFDENDKKISLRQVAVTSEFHQFLDNATQLGTPSDAKMSVGQRTLIFTLVPIEAQANMLIAHDVSASEQLNISKNTFVANVSHELRTPLTVISGFLETLQEMPDLDKTLQNEFVLLMQKESKRMLDLVEGLLTLSRLENGEHQSNFEPVCLSELVQDVVQDTLALGTKHQITTEIVPDVWVLGVYKELYSALSNLAFNAVRHTKEHTNVHICLHKQEQKVVFFVQDDGEGIATEHVPHLTERFYRVDKGRSRKTGGSGLGLAITKHALMRHKALLQIDSEVGKGSIFKVLFDGAIKNK